MPPVVDQHTWEAELAELRAREKAATHELDAIAAARRRLPMVELPEYTLDSEVGQVRLVDVFEGKRQLIVYHHMWFPAEEWQCPGCTGFTSQFTRLEFLDSYDARFVIVTQGPIDEALAYKARVGNKMIWYSSAHSSFGADMGAPQAEASRSTCSFASATLGTGPTTPRAAVPSSSATASPDRPATIRTPRGGRTRRSGWPQSPTYSRWAPSEAFARTPSQPEIA